MLRLARVAFASVMLMGCIPTQESAALLEESVAKLAASVTPLPDRVADEILVVSGDRDKFSRSDHPLSNVAAGTAVDPLNKLQGCWGRIEEIHDSENGASVLTFVRVLKFDVHARTVEELALFDTAGPPYASAQVFIRTISKYEVAGDNGLYLRGKTSEAAGVVGDGKLVFDYGAAVLGSMNSTTDYPMLATVAAEYLKLREGDLNQKPGDMIVGEDEDTAELWIRFDCP